MKPILLCVLLATAAGLRAAEPDRSAPVFDGATFAGWEGDTNQTWRIVAGAILGGSLEATVPRNEFLCTTRRYTNFVLHVRFKLEGTEGFVNAGVQVRSQRVPHHHEVSGYQCDIGEGWWGALYDESRRNKVLVSPDAAAVKNALKRGDWNEYRIRCEGPRIRTYLNGVPMVDYREPDDSIPQHGILGLQIHGGGKAQVSYKDIRLEVLP
jgi:hypothetical protein